MSEYKPRFAVGEVVRCIDTSGFSRVNAEVREYEPLFGSVINGHPDGPPHNVNSYTYIRIDRKCIQWRGYCHSGWAAQPHDETEISTSISVSRSSRTAVRKKDVLKTRSPALDWWGRCWVRYALRAAPLGILTRRTRVPPACLGPGNGSGGVLAVSGDLRAGGQRLRDHPGSRCDAIEGSNGCRNRMED